MLGFRVKRTLKMGLKSLWLHKLRSALTALGIVCGVLSVIAMLAIGEGASYEAQEQIRQLGSHNIILRSVRPPEEQSVASEQTWALKYGLTYLDAERIRSTVPGIEVIAPTRAIRKHIRTQRRMVDGSVVGTVPWFCEIANRKVLRGRFIAAVDMQRRAAICVLNEATAKALFPFQDPIGKTVRTGGNAYRVVGIVADPASGDGQEAEGTYNIYIPMTTAQRHYGEIMLRRRSGSFEATIVQLHSLTVRVPDLDQVIPTAKAIERVLELSHEKKDYEVKVPLELLERAKATSRIFNLVLGSIAAISLFVGGIGITNIMLATVTERTREIGIRRALGARRRDIVIQFLAETTLLSASGGIIGVALGLIIPYLVTRFAGMRTIVTPSSLILALSISIAVGLVSGIYPAYRAASLNPIEALRHE